MRPDCELLCQYAERGDQAAFAEVVRRHLDLVYASAVRLLNGDAALAEDVTQTVFADMARKAGQLAKHASVVGWLHTSVRYAASSAVRTEQRRRAREQEASAMSDQMTATQEMFWGQLRPLIDEAVGQLQEPERDALLLRFFEEKSHREVGTALGLTENAARMRIERALDKLRVYFLRHGVTASAALLATTLGTQAASPPAPTGLAASVITKSLAGAGLKVSGSVVAKSWLSTWLGASGHGALVGATAFGAATFASLIYVRYEMNPRPPAPAKVSLLAPANRMKNSAAPATPAGNGTALAAAPAGVTAAVENAPEIVSLVAQATDLAAQEGQFAQADQPAENKDPAAPANDNSSVANEPTGSPVDGANTAPANTVATTGTAVPANTQVNLEKAQPFSEGLAAIQRGGRWGYIDKTGKVVIPAVWSLAGAFTQGMAPVRQAAGANQNIFSANKVATIWGYIDRNGKLSIKPQWNFAGKYSEGLAVVSRQDSFATHPEWGYIDANGQMAIKPQWTWASPFSDGLATVAQGDQWTVIDQTGKQVLDLSKLGVPGETVFSEGLAPVYVRWRGWAYIDKTGRRVIDAHWDRAAEFSEGLARVARQGQTAAIPLEWAYIDKSGKVAIDLAKQNLADCLNFSEGLAGVYSLSAQRWGFIDKNGQMAIAPKWDEVLPFSEDLAAVRLGTQWGYINKSGDIVIGKLTATSPHSAATRLENPKKIAGQNPNGAIAGTINNGRAGAPTQSIVIQPLVNNVVGGGTAAAGALAGAAPANSAAVMSVPNTGANIAASKSN